MAQNLDLRVLSTPGTVPTSSSVVSLYANSTSGIMFQDAAGVSRYVGGQLTGYLSFGSIRSGGAATLGTGIIFTAFTGAGAANQTGLGLPSFFAPILGSDGLTYGFPCYPLR